MRQHRWYLHRTALFLATLVVLWAVWYAYSVISAQRKTDPSILAQMREHKRVEIWAELPFTPEEFHIHYMQDRGTVTGVSGNWIHLVGVSPSSAWTIARQYWVERVTTRQE